MSVFNGFFGRKNETDEKKKKKIPWIPLISMDQLDIIASKSETRTQMIFKHSTTCGVSRMVLNLFGNNFDFNKDQFDTYFLDLHNYRTVSNEINDRFKIVHQSPQLLVVKSGVVAAHASHGAIANLNLESYI